MARPLWAEKKLLTLEILLFILFILAFELLLGWKVALILTAFILIHESGHIWTMHHFKLGLRAFLFIPMAGAVVVPAANEYPSENADGWVSLMGPVWGFGSALLALGLWRLSGLQIFHEAAFFAALINIFNLDLLYPLDGGRLMRCFTHKLAPSKGLAVFSILNLVSLLPIAWAAWLTIQAIKNPEISRILIWVSLGSLVLMVGIVIFGAYTELRDRMLLIWYESTLPEEKRKILKQGIDSDSTGKLREKLFLAAASYRRAEEVKLSGKQLIFLLLAYLATLAGLVILILKFFRIW